MTLRSSPILLLAALPAAFVALMAVAAVVR